MKIPSLVSKFKVLSSVEVGPTGEEWVDGGGVDESWGERTGRKEGGETDMYVK